MVRSVFIPLFWIFRISTNSHAAPSSNNKCNEALATPLSHSAFSGSSVFTTGYAPGYAKLNRRGGAGGWSPLDNDHYPWLQVDLSNRKQVMAIATQGRYSSLDWTTHYRLLYSDMGWNWKPYNQDGNIWVFTGNSNTGSVVRHDLQHRIVARYLRFIPVGWSDEGRIGLRIEIYGCSYWADVIHFDGQGVISYRFKTKKMKNINDVIELNFKTAESDGVILHSEGQQGDYITLQLRKGRLLLQINLGSNHYGSILGHTSVSSGSLLDDHHWHSVVIERYRRNVNFTLDQHTHYFRTSDEFNHLNLDYELTFGGMPYSGKPIAGRQKNFIGCMEITNYNGENITDLARRKKLDTSRFHNLTFSCMDSHTFPVSFNSTSFLQLPGRRQYNMVSVSFQFRTWNANGLLLFTGLLDGMLEIVLKDGNIIVHISVQKHSRIKMASGSGLNDGEWHDVHFWAKENFAVLTIDRDESTAMRTNAVIHITTSGMYHFGGYFLATLVSPSQQSFQGCMQLIQVDDQLADISTVEQGLIGAFENVSLDMCAIIDRCLPNHCEHGGRCTQTWDTFRCSCDGTGYTGATCHSSVYEQSCEAYKHLGKTSDIYWIDPDGSGPLGPFRVICNMTEDKVWTKVVNSLPAQMTISSSSRERHTVLQLNYSATMEQISAITDVAEHCEQQITYRCRSSRLLNTPNGSPYTWWVGRGYKKHFYWGGSAPGIRKCSCGIKHNCTNPNYYCNCDANHKHWSEDSGLLVYKDHLPVSQVVVGDTIQTGSEAKLTVGVLQCHGDKSIKCFGAEKKDSSSQVRRKDCNPTARVALNSAEAHVTFTSHEGDGLGSYWNAASFTTPSSYLHFPTFQGKTSADISFYFKTSAPHGVFMENLGNTDFIRLELKSPTVVSFSFDVGNGPVELKVHSPTPLNDDQWHCINAERNVKEAVLKLDQQYRKVLTAPVQGHTHLELSSQLYVGAARGQRGFLGCIRSLKMNGVTLTLEDRAKVTPGVKPGCSGHCTSFGMYCCNGGKCVEKYNGYSCDCSRTAYEGPFCTKDVGAFFEAGTLVRYNLVPELMASTSSMDGKDLSQSQQMEKNLTQEFVSFSFSTISTPSILLYISSWSHDYMAVVLRHNGTLQLRYNLQGLHEPFTIDLDQHNLANGQPHNIKITRIKREIQVQLDHYPPFSYTLPEASDYQFTMVKTLFLGKVYETDPIDPMLTEKYNAPGFVGCLSRVQFNSIAPLKAALRSQLSLVVSHQGKLVESNCASSPLTTSPMSATTDPWHLNGGASFPFNEEILTPDGLNRNSAIIGGIIAVVIFTILCILLCLIRYMFLAKGTYHTNEPKRVNAQNHTYQT